MSENSQINFEDTAIGFASRSTRELKRVYLLFLSMRFSWMVDVGTFLARLALKLRLPVKGIIKRSLFQQFCGGESIPDCQKSIDHLESFNIKTILDYSVEGLESEESFDHTMEEALRIADYARNASGIPFCVVKLTGLGSSTIMEKVQSNQKLSKEEAVSFDSFKKRVEKIAERVAENRLRFMIDAEETWIEDVIDEIALELMRIYNQNGPVVYITYQLYRKDALKKLKNDYRHITEGGCFFAAKLVRGAYMEKERERAEELGYPDPIQLRKKDTDRDYKDAISFAMQHIDNFAICAGTHNEQSSQILATLMEQNQLPRNDERVYFAQLFGMSDNISFKLSDLGYNVAKYVPYGPVDKVLPYLFRRAEENTSIAGQSSREYALIKKELKRRKKN